MSKRPKLLFLAYYFPPVQSSGCVRSWSIAKHLARLGWNVTIVTPHPSVWQNVEAPENVAEELEREGIRRILTGHRWRCLSPDHLKIWNRGLGWVTGGVCRKIARKVGLEREIGWIKEAGKACSELTPNDVDVILATGSPFSSFGLAMRLAKKLGRPYVLDYRDHWSDNPHSTPAGRRVLNHKEVEVIAGCSAVTAVSDLLLDRRFGLGPKLHIITNGFDTDEMARVKPENFGHFAIVYTGDFYPPKRVITPVMAVLKALKISTTGLNDGNWYFHYYGAYGKHVSEEATRFGITDKVVLHGVVSRSQALSAVRGAGAAVVITSVSNDGTPEEKGIVTSKLFDALGLGTPILLIAPSGSFVESIVKTSGSTGLFRGSNIDGMGAYILDLMRGRPPARRDILAYAWENITKQLDKVLRDTITKQSTMMHSRPPIHSPLHDRALTS